MFQMFGMKAELKLIDCSEDWDTNKETTDVLGFGNWTILKIF